MESKILLNVDPFLSRRREEAFVHSPAFQVLALHRTERHNTVFIHSAVAKDTLGTFFPTLKNTPFWFVVEPVTTALPSIKLDEGGGGGWLWF